MPRTFLLGSLAGALIGWSWFRLEDHTRAGQALLVVALAIAPALLRRARWRIVAVPIAFLLAAASAFELGLTWHFLGRVLSRFGDGFLDFYDVQVPFDAGAHARMHGVIVLAVFAFTLVVALALAARRPGIAAVGLVVGVAWPVTLLPTHELLVGALLLLTVLAIIAGGRAGSPRAIGYVLGAAAIVLLAGVAASSSPALAKRAFLNWQTWDPYTKPEKPVDVSYVWNSQYTGLTFPKKQTTVLRIKAGPTPNYWRASVLNTVTGGRWIEELSPEGFVRPPLGEQGLVPERERNASAWVEQTVHVEALRDTHLVGGSTPVNYDASGIGIVLYDPTGVAVGTSPTSRGQSYDVWSYLPKPTPAELLRSPARYAGPILAPERKYREVEAGVYPKLFGTPGRQAFLNYLFTHYARAPLIRPYRPLSALAEQLAGSAKSPYAAAIALERWFRFGGDFIYDQHPPHTPGVPPLVDFVTRTHRGYCQHFAGAMALMLRYLGIPSRVAVGFRSGKYDRSKGEWVVSDRDAHAWVEVWFRGWGWLPFDPTPAGNGLDVPYSSSSPSFDAGAISQLLGSAGGLSRRLGKLGFGGAPRISPDVPDLAAAPAVAVKHHSRAPGLLRLLALVLAGLGLVVVAAKFLLRRSRYLTRDPRRLASACRSDLRDFLLDQRVDVPESATLRELADLVEQEFDVEATAFGLHASAARFGPAASAREAAAAMQSDLRDLRRHMRRELTNLERLRGLFSLRSLGLTS